jgi:hypothetical protein
LRLPRVTIRGQLIIVAVVAVALHPGIELISRWGLCLKRIEECREGERRSKDGFQSAKRAYDSWASDAHASQTRKELGDDVHRHSLAYARSSMERFAQNAAYFARMRGEFLRAMVFVWEAVPALMRGAP